MGIVLKNIKHAENSIMLFVYYEVLETKKKNKEFRSGNLISIFASDFMD